VTILATMVAGACDDIGNNGGRGVMISATMVPRDMTILATMVAGACDDIGNNGAQGYDDIGNNGGRGV